MDMDEIIGQLQVGPGGAVTDVPMEKTIEELGDFQFSTEKDDQGIRIQQPSFVKKNCKNCLGRGGIIQSLGGRHWQPCGCLIRGYVKARREHDEAIRKSKEFDSKLKKLAERDDLVAAIVQTRQNQMMEKP